MVVATFSRLLPQPQPPPQAALFRPARHVHRLIQIRSAPSRPSLVLSFAPARRPPRSSAQENGDASETLEEGEAAAGGKETYEKKKNEEEKQAAESSMSSVADEIKEMMDARKKSSSSSSASDMWGGVAEEVREIEWPAFGSVLGTTGVVLAVIAGSGVALLTVNAILAEISDRVFAGRGIQDLFG